jgi:hypothetical protein
MGDRIEVMEEIGLRTQTTGRQGEPLDQGRGPGQTASQNRPVALQLAMHSIARLVEPEGFVENDL